MRWNFLGSMVVTTQQAPGGEWVGEAHIAELEPRALTCEMGQYPVIDLDLQDDGRVLRVTAPTEAECNGELLVALANWLNEG